MTFGKGIYQMYSQQTAHIHYSKISFYPWLFPYNYDVLSLVRFKLFI